MDFLAIGLAIATVGWCAKSHIGDTADSAELPFHVPMSLFTFAMIVAGMC